MEIFSTEFISISILFFLVAVAYSSVGHAGASGYSAVMALMGVNPFLMRPTSLILNLIVGAIGLYRFGNAGLVSVKRVFPFLIASMPAAYWSAQLHLEKKYFYLALGFILITSGIRLLFSNLNTFSDSEVKVIYWPVALVAGGIIGFLSGITGTGGAIFFTPLLLKMKWADPRHAAGLSVIFVLANSIFALTGIFKSSQFFDFQTTMVWICFVAIGAFVGTHWGIFKFSNMKMQKMLGAVMILAAIKLLSVTI